MKKRIQIDLTPQEIKDCEKRAKKHSRKRKAYIEHLVRNDNKRK